ncbi:MAG: hypothetical protein JNL74_22680 [Fibrobacteres bacterium]|nr:hypothetical protein [Fibrobacterota bacterium]
MTNRERIVQTLLCGKTDRAPFGVGIGFSTWGETLKRWRSESGIADLNPAEYFGYDKDFAVVPVEYGPCPHFEKRIISEDSEYIISYDYRGLTMRNRRDGGSMPDFLESPVKTWDDWKRYKAERLQPNLSERLKNLDPFIAKIVNVDAPIQLGVYPWGVFGTARDILGAEEFLIGFYTEPDLIHDIMETYTDLWLTIFQKVTEKIKVDHIHIWEDMSYKNGSLISVEMIEEFMMPQYDKILAFAKMNDIALVSVDSDGNVKSLLPVMHKHGINTFLPFEVQAGNDIIEFREQYPNLGIIGGLDKNVLMDTAPKDALHKELDRCELILSMGGYIPGFDHLIPPNVSWSKWCYFIGCIRKIILQT